MRVIELIHKLEEMLSDHGDLEVFTEGCDCDGDIGLVSFTKENTYKNRASGKNIPKEITTPAFIYLERSR